jgi:nucleoside-diphosphate-sugar epimerase
LKVLFYGGTRFVGKALVSSFLSKGYEIFVFTRGKLPVPKNITHLKGDRSKDEDLKKTI